MGALFIETSKNIMKQEHRDKHDDIVTLYRTDSFNSLTTKIEHAKNYSDSFINNGDFERIFVEDNIKLFSHSYNENKDTYVAILNSGERILLGYIGVNKDGSLNTKNKNYKHEILIDEEGNITSREFKVHNRDYVIDKILK